MGRFRGPVSVSAVFLLITYIATSFSQELMCCSHATGTCKTICGNISLVQLAADSTLRDQTILEVQKFCSIQLITFWECLNATFKDIARGDSWFGRVCCPLPNSENCRRACVTATSSADVVHGCRQSDEIAFFGCLERQKMGEECCRNALTDECQTTCVETFRTQTTPSKVQRQKLKDNCQLDSPRVAECVKEIVKVTPVKNTNKHIVCCDKSNNIKCRETCKDVLTTKNTVEEIYDGLQKGGCGTPLLQDVFWQCFLIPEADPVSTSAEVSRIDKVGIDSAKWHCCQRANSTQCARLCSRTFTKFWSTSWEDFYRKCLVHVSEENLRNCIDEVDEPCELGCDGLSFCTNFNNRPTELFRSCTSQADEAARSDVALWQTQNTLSLPELKLPLKSIAQCSPNVWKAIACTLQIKPCSRRSHANQICRDVCLNVLRQCVDWTQLSPVHSPETICKTLSPEDPNVSCIKLENFLYPSEYFYPRITDQVSSPCKGNPCEENEICTINKNCIHNGGCQAYTCVPGCKLGEVSPYMVPEQTYVRLPIPNNSKECLKICKCNRNRIEECQPLLCITLTSCLLGNMQQMHGTTFAIDCNTCSCYAGEKICSKKQCESSALSGRNTAYTTLPCNCPPHYIPVCGRNGVTYPSACLAKCNDLNDADIEHQACQNPCSKANVCPIGQKCVPKPQICLSLMHKPCTQYECINGSTECNRLPKEPVCDTDNRQFDNACLLAHHNAKLAYRGHCLKRCRHNGQVCGFNGKTYISECAAFADMVNVDYEGPCIAVGLITDQKSHPCPNIKCAPLPDRNCLGITPPGACCPICGGAMRVLYSRKQIDRALYALQKLDTKSLNLHSMLAALERQIQLAQCTLRGFVTVEMDVFVTIQTTERHPSALQLEACVREAEKIASLINMQSPRIASELSLSSLTAATLVHTQTNASLSHLFYGQPYFIVIFILIVKFIN